MADSAAASLQSRLNALESAGSDRVVRAVDVVLAEADRLAASDVHFEPTSRALEIRFRIDGVLRTVATFPRELTPNVVARLKVMSELLTYRLDIPQEGSIRTASGSAHERRVSTFPTVQGEKVVVRLFNPDEELLDLDGLGLPEEELARLDGLLRERSGAVFLTGPSGSGKTTTIYACLRRLSSDSVGRHLVTIEDPVERVIPGVTQSQARPGTDFDFARGIRSLLRQDPDVIMIGEIRDRETAAVAIEAALTGHLVFSTLHAGSASGVVGRLLEMGIEPYLLTSGIRGILNQRLLRKLCPACKKVVGSEYAAVGCDHCVGTGYCGRFLIAELLVPDAAFRKAILEKADTDALDAVAATAGLRTVNEAAIAALKAGLTTRQEVERVLGSSFKWN